MTEQEITAVLRAQAHIRARKRAMIYMALGKMENTLERSGVIIHPDVWAEYCRQSLAALLQPDFSQDLKSRVATIAKDLDENHQCRPAYGQAASAQRPAQTWLRPSGKDGNKARRRREPLRCRLILQCTDDRELPELGDLSSH